MSIHRYYSDFCELFSTAVHGSGLTVALNGQRLLDRSSLNGIFSTAIWWFLDSFSLNSQEELALCGRTKVLGSLFCALTNESFQLVSQIEKKRGSDKELTELEANRLPVLWKELKVYLHAFSQETRIRALWKSIPELSCAASAVNQGWVDQITPQFIEKFAFHCRWIDIENISKNYFLKSNYRKWIQRLDLTKLSQPVKEQLGRKWVKFALPYFQFTGRPLRGVAPRAYILGKLSCKGLRPIFASMSRWEAMVLSELEKGEKVQFLKGTYEIASYTFGKRRTEIPLVQAQDQAILIYSPPYRLWEEYATSGHLLDNFIEEHATLPIVLVKKSHVVISLQEAVRWVNTLVALDFTYVTYDGTPPEKEDFYVDEDGVLHLGQGLQKIKYDIEIILQTAFNLADRNYDNFETLYDQSFLKEHPLISYSLEVVAGNITFFPKNPSGQTKLYTQEMRVTYLGHYEAFCHKIFNEVSALHGEDGIFDTELFEKKIVLAWMKHTRAMIVPNDIVEILKRAVEE